jgi:hypothetical protein
MNSALFIAMCVLALLNIIVYTFVSSAIHKRDLCQKSPYYHCDTSWQCCAAGKDNCDTSPGGPQNKVNAYSIAEHFYGQNTTKSLGGGNDHRGLGYINCKTPASSKPYYEACVQPIQVITKNYDGSQGAPNFSCVYDANSKCMVGSLDLELTYLQPAYGVSNFVAGQCCYQKFDSDNAVNAPVTYGTPGNLYPNKDSLTKWNSNGRYANNYSQPSNFIFPVGSNTNTQNNTCNNSLYAPIPGAPYTPDGYDQCP